VQVAIPSLVVHATDVEESKGVVVLAEKTPMGVPPLPPVYVAPRKNIKRRKKGSTQLVVEGADGTTETTNALSAGSRGERRQAQ
jgi:hypothetical protein